MTTKEKYDALKDIIPIDRMGANNPRADEQQTLYGDVLDWLRDNGYGKDHDLAVLVIGNHAIQKKWNGAAPETESPYRNLSREDVRILSSFGHTEEDISQIDESVKLTIYRTEGKRISSKKAREILGDREFLSGLSRSSFHWTATREKNGITVSFDSRKLFLSQIH